MVFTMRVLYRHVTAKLSEEFLKKIESAKFELAVVPFGKIKHMSDSLGREPRIIVIEMMNSEFQKTLNLIKKINKDLRDDMMSRVGILVLFMAEQPDAVCSALETERSFCMVRRNPDSVVEMLNRIRRCLQRLYAAARLRITLSTDAVRIWMAGLDHQDHELVLSPKLLQLLLCLARNRYATAEFIERSLNVRKGGAKTYMMRLKHAYDKFNQEELHCALDGVAIFKTLEFDDITIYRIQGTVIFDE